MSLLTNPLVQAVVLLLLGIVLHRNRQRLKQMYAEMNSRETTITPLVQPYLDALEAERRAKQQASNAYASSSNASALEDASRSAASMQAPTQPAWGNASPALQTIKLSTLVDAQNILVCGPKGSGKTTVLRTLVAKRKGEIIALDPHNSPGKWSGITIGGGLEWSAIDAAMQKMQRDMQQRFKELNAGHLKEGEFPLRSYVGDEFLAIAQELDGKSDKAHAGKLLISRITQGRKVNECILVAAQSDTVEALGIQGNADLKACFDYLIFLGGLIETRAKYHSCPEYVRQAALKSDRPAVVWHPERNNWYLLVYDLEPVREGEMLSSSPSEPAEPAEPVRHEGAILSDPNQFANQFERTSSSGSADQDATQGGSSFSKVNDRYELVRELVRAGKSGNKIHDMLGGTRSDNLDMVRKARQELGLVDAA